MLFSARAESPSKPSPPTGKTAAVVGGGIAGLCAAYYLALEGHACTLYLEDIPLEDAPPAGILGSLGIVFRSITDAEIDVRAEEAAKSHDVVLAASGPDSKTALRKKMPAVSAADGREAARAAHLYLSDPRRTERKRVTFIIGEEIDTRRSGFDSRLGALFEGELEEFLKGAAPHSRMTPSGGEIPGGAVTDGGEIMTVASDPGGEGFFFDENEAAGEAGRCLRCDCAKKNRCALRRYASRYGARGGRPTDPRRKRFERLDGGHVSGTRFRIQYEPGKCIKCGICVRITESRGEDTGLAFLGRGYDVRVGVPFGGPLSSALAKTAEECSRACPTGALALIPARPNGRGEGGA
jgi:ferredoxin